MKKCPVRRIQKFYGFTVPKDNNKVLIHKYLEDKVVNFKTCRERAMNSQLLVFGEGGSDKTSFFED